MKLSKRDGFTLIELAIVLVIIGLLVGGVLVGNDLIKSGEVRAQIAQMEKFNTAVNTFHVKYNALPGDINATTAAQFGFIPRAGSPGRGDGNGLLDGWCYQCNAVLPVVQSGEPLIFWVDLSAANLMDGSFTTANDAALPSVFTNLSPYLPSSKINQNAYIYVSEFNGQNWFSLSNIGFLTNYGDYAGSSSTLTVKQAYALDAKMDDGLPTTGNVIAAFPLGGSFGGNDSNFTQATNAPSPSASTCYDTTSGTYSVGQINGLGVNCALSFRFQ